MARVPTVVFVREARCGCVDVRDCLPYLLPEIDNGTIIRVQKLTEKFSLLVSDKQASVLSVLTICF